MWRAWVGRWRLRNVQTPLRRVLETMLISGSFAVVGFWLSYVTRSCKTKPKDVRAPAVDSGC